VDKKPLIRKWLVFGIILLFVGLSFLSSPAMGKIWFYAHVDCDTDGVSSDITKYSHFSKLYFEQAIYRL